MGAFSTAASAGCVGCRAAPLDPAGLHAEPRGIEWSITTPSTEAGPKSFPVLAIHLQNRSSSAETLHLHIDAGSLRCLSGVDLSVELQPGEEKALLHTLYVPPRTPGGSEIRISARSDDGHSTKSFLSASPPLPTARRPLMAVKRVSYIPAKRRVTSSRLPIPGTSLYIAQFNPRLPPRLRAMAASQTLIVPIGETMDTAIEVETGER